MTYSPASYPQGTFTWADFFSKDREAARTFYQQLFDWTSTDMPTSEGRPDYTMFYKDGHQVAGGSPGFSPNMPSYWTSYITVDDVDAMADKAQKLGATITMRPMDVLDSGRMTTLQDPTGAHVALWQPKKHKGADLINTTGAMSWNELYTKDLDQSIKFYTDLLGWEIKPEPEMDNYHVIYNQGRSNGGMFLITPEMGNFPPHWMVYFTVDDIEASITKVKDFGGQLYMGPKDIGVGQIATIADPTGAAIMLIQMAGKPEEWPS